jgi:leukotriene-A4 hydrolase
MSRPDPHSYSDDAQPRVTHFDLSLSVDFKARVLAGAITLRLNSASAREPLDLDSRDLTIEAVTTQSGAALSYTLGLVDPIMGQRLRIDLLEGTSAIIIKYRTSPAASALQWLDPEQTAGRAHPYLFSQCQAIHARSIAPLPDSPRVRVTYHAELTVPDGLSAVMAAAPAGRNGNTFLFDMPQPIPTYLLALAVGNIAGRDLSARSRVYAEPQILDAASHEFANVESMIVAAEKLFGEYPWERFDLLVMPPSFPYGGMENPRLTFLTPTLLAGDRSLVNVVVHELSHSWTGNLVTNATLEDFWLNEGFTVYAERRLLEVLDGADAAALHAAICWSGLAEDMDRLGRTSPLTALCTRLEGVDPDDVYSQVPYEKGCLFLTRIEQAVGRPAFDAFLREYLRRFRFTSITTKDFLACLTEQLPGIGSKVDLHTWLHLPDFPADAPRATSRVLEKIEGLVRGWRPEEAALRALDAHEWQVLLPRLSLPAEEWRWLNERFALAASTNAEIRVAFLTGALKAGEHSVLAQAEQTLMNVGRMKYLRPLYTALKSMPDAKRIFEAAKQGYHPVARQVMAGVVSNA